MHLLFYSLNFIIFLIRIIKILLIIIVLKKNYIIFIYIFQQKYINYL